jgi:dTDP-4-amino-4,6-dideoxygalactose transaminase/hydroxypyruvate isomerase
MSLKQSVVYPPFARLFGFREFCELLGRIGFAGVEIWERPERVDDLRQMVDTARALGLTLVSFVGTQALQHGDPSDEAARELVANIELASSLGIPALVVPPGPAPAGRSRADQHERYVAFLRGAAPTAEAKGVTLLVENLNTAVDHPHVYCPDPAFVLDICQATGSPHVKMLYDIYHAQVMRGDIIRFIREHIGSIGHVQAAGNPGRAEIDDSQELNFPGICRAIASLGYQGFFGHEYFPRLDPELGLRAAFSLCDQRPATSRQRSAEEFFADVTARLHTLQLPIKRSLALVLGGAPDQAWKVDFPNKRVIRGERDGACVLHASEPDFLSLVNGTEQAGQLIADGRLTWEGDPQLAFLFSQKFLSISPARETEPPKVGADELAALAETWGYSAHVVARVRVAAASEPRVGANLSRCDNPRSRVEAVERRARDLFGVRHALAVNSGTSALNAASVALGIGSGDEVIVPGYAAVATAAAVVNAGAVPVLADIDDTGCIDPDDIERKITPRTRAITVTHTMGFVCDMDRILAVARRHDLPVIEDCAQACGAQFKDRYVGSLGAIGCFSLSARTICGGGEGGLMLTGDERIHCRARSQDLEMSELEAAVNLVQLDKLESTIRRYRSRARYVMSQCDLPETVRLRRSNDVEGDIGDSLMFLVRDPDAAPHLIKALVAREVSASGPFAKTPPHDSLDLCPRTLDVTARAMFVPVSQWWTDEECTRVAQRITSACRTIS